MKTFTIDDIRTLGPCYDPARYLPEGWSGTALDILAVEDCPAEDRLWVVLHDEWIPSRTMRLFAVRCARQALALIDSPDPRSVAACDVAERYANGQADDKELATARAAASDAASATAWATASDAARAAASATAWATARVAAWATARATASDAARAAASATAWATASDAARAAASATAWATARVAAWATARATASDAARAAASATAWATARAAASATARDAQVVQLRAMLIEAK